MNEGVLRVTVSRSLRKQRNFEINIVDKRHYLNSGMRITLPKTHLKAAAMVRRMTARQWGSHASSLELVMVLTSSGREVVASQARGSFREPGLPSCAARAA